MDVIELPITNAMVAIAKGETVISNSNERALMFSLRTVERQK